VHREWGKGKKGTEYSKGKLRVDMAPRQRVGTQGLEKKKGKNRDKCISSEKSPNEEGDLHLDRTT